MTILFFGNLFGCHMIGRRQKPIEFILQTGMVRRVYFNDSAISGVRPLSGHNDHIHVEVIE
jgi:hypothetical protein